MAILNVTYRGLSADIPVEIDTDLSDTDIRRVAVEMLRSGGVPGMTFPDTPDDAFDGFVVDRFDSAEGSVRFYLRPKVPFGA